MRGFWCKPSATGLNTSFPADSALQPVNVKQMFTPADFLCLLFLAAWFWLCSLTAQFAERRGHPRYAYFLLSFFFSPLVGALVLLLAGKNEKGAEAHELKTGQAKKCPACAEMVKREAQICRFCGHSFVTAMTTSAAPRPARFYQVAKDGQVLGSWMKRDIVESIRAGRLSVQDYFLDDDTNEWQPVETLIHDTSR